jgi:drug/metabolite transporter (DMT)-like permease
VVQLAEALLRQWATVRALQVLQHPLLACEVGGAAAFVLGARHSIAVTSVLASQFAALAALAAFVLFRERLTRVQLAGIAIIAAGVAALSALQA